MIETAAGKALVERTRQLLVDLREHEKVSVAEANEIAGVIGAHLRSSRPLALAPIPTTTETK